MSCMATLWEKLEALCEDRGTSPYKVALNVGLDGSLPNKVFNNKVPATFDRKLGMLKEMAESSLLNADFDELAAWLAEEYLSDKAIGKLKTKKTIEATSAEDLLRYKKQLESME